MRVYISPHTFKMKLNIKFSLDWNWLFHYCFIFCEFKQPTSVWRQTRPSNFYLCHLWPTCSGGHISGKPWCYLQSFLYFLMCFKPVVQLVLASIIFARPENYSTLGLCFLFFFLNGRHSLWLRTSCYAGHMSKNLWLSFPHNLLNMLAVSSRYLSSLVTHAQWKLCNVIAASLAFDNKCQTRITRNNTSNVSVTLSHCGSNCAAVLTEIRSSVACSLCSVTYLICVPASASGLLSDLQQIILSSFPFLFLI